MPFVPHTQEEIKAMLDEIGTASIESLFDEIPANLRSQGLNAVPEGMSELDVSRLMRERAAQDERTLCFAGAGAYEHHIPAAVWELVSRGEFYSAYTPYQAEASQGTLQLLYEYQTMMTRLTGMDVSNASLYDGASALAEAILMAVRSHRKSESKRILTPRTIHPHYRQVAHAIVHHQGIKLEELDYDRKTGAIDPNKLPENPGDVTAIIIPQPNFFGVLEDVDAITDWAHRHNILVVALVNPMSLALLKPPAQWGSAGADMVCGDGQPLGAPMSSGGPYFGFLTCRKEYVRQMPGRIIGRTVDRDGKPGFVLTLQAREQHIRRSKATSNICTNQGLLVTAATIYMSLVGPQGLRNVALNSHHNTALLVEKLAKLGGVKKQFNRPFFHEAVFTFEQPVAEVLRALGEQGIIGGVSLEQYYPELGNSLLLCATETKTMADIDTYVESISRIATRLQSSKNTAQPRTA